jgi:NAD(P)-dependent dehydrogenase (short-subunit alcohol dehydrogenase family)
MATSQTILMTGATSGLGLNAVQYLSRHSNVNLIVGVRNPEQAHHLRSVIPKERLIILPLDLASLESVRQFAAMVIDRLGDRQLTAIALNAGIQITTGLERTEDGYERTFASNYLGHFLLVWLLLPVLAEQSVVISTASGTHDPKDFLSKQFGFRGGFFPSAEAIAKGNLDNSVSLKQQCLDRYATSKLCNLLFTYDMSRRVSPDRARFLAFDPGLMPGTNLARDRGAVERFAWNYILPILGWFVAGVSSPRRSARSLFRLLTEPAIAPISGQHFDCRLRQPQTSDDSQRQDWQHELHTMSVRLCGAEIMEFKGAES